MSKNIIEDVTVLDTIRKMNDNTLAIYLHSWQTEDKTVEEIKELLKEKVR